MGMLTESLANRPLRDGGVTVWEGGVRTACIVRWPGKLPAGTVCAEPLVSMDFLPMFLNAAGVPLPSDRTLDGLDPTETLAGRARSAHAVLGFRWARMSALRAGRYKIVRAADDAPWQLYDLKDDQAETRDLARAHPEVVARLAARFTGWDRDVRRW